MGVGHLYGPSAHIFTEAPNKPAATMLQARITIAGSQRASQLAWLDASGAKGEGNKIPGRAVSSEF